MPKFETYPITNFSFAYPSCVEDWNAHVAEVGAYRSFEEKELAGCPERFAPLTTFKKEPLPDATKNIYLVSADTRFRAHQWDEWITQCEETGILRVNLSWEEDSGTRTGQFVETEVSTTLAPTCALRAAYWGDVNDDGRKDVVLVTRGQECSYEASSQTFIGDCTDLYYIFDVEGGSGTYQYVDNQDAGYYPQCAFEEFCGGSASGTVESTAGGDGFTISIGVTFGTEPSEPTAGAETAEANPIPGESTGGCSTTTGSNFGRPRPSLFDWLAAGIVSVVRSWE